MMQFCVAGRRGAAAYYAIGIPDAYRPIGKIFVVFRGAVIQSLSFRAHGSAGRVAPRPKTPARAPTTARFAWGHPLPSGACI